MLGSRLRILLAFAAVTAATALGSWTARGERIYYHRGVRYNTAPLRTYDYQMPAGTAAASIVAVAPVDEPRDINTGAVPSEPGSKDTRKSFFVDRPSIAVDSISLGRIALSLYGDGRYVGSGLLSFDGGGNNKSLEGANAMIRVRAYAGAPQQAGPLNNMRLLWETHQRYWIGRDQSRAISLFPEPCGGPSPLARKGTHTLVRDTDPQPPSTLIKEHFVEITHLEIVLEHMQDR